MRSARTAAVDGEPREALLEKTEGNPLFVEETVRMLAECGRRPLRVRDRIPDTLQALIAARIDRLPPEEKAAPPARLVIGRIFWGGALKDLAPERRRARAGARVPAAARLPRARGPLDDLGRDARTGSSTC